MAEFKMAENTKWRKFTKSAKRDFGLQVGEKTYWVSRRQLADLSRIFGAVINGENTNVEIVELTDKQPKDILEMLRCLFPTRGQGHSKAITDQNIDLLLQLANDYEIGKLTAKCSAALTRKINFGGSIEGIVVSINRANLYQLKDVVRVGLRKLSEMDPSKVVQEAAYNYLPWNMHLCISMMAWFRASRPPPVHECSNFLEISYGWPHAFKKCMHCDYRGCDYPTCNLHRWNGEKAPDCLPICRTCNTEYGSAAAEFVCKCVDHLIKAQLEKYGL